MTEPPSQPSVFALIREHGLDPKKSLGQNFLIDESHLAAIAAAADLTPADTVLEIGPGLGVLTRHLAQQAGRVVAVELDDRLLPILRQRFAPQPHVSFVHADILEIAPAEIFQRAEAEAAVEAQKHNTQYPLPNTSLPTTSYKSYKVVANLPYYITSAVLRHLLEAAQPPSLAVVLVQREVAQRIVAQPGDLSLLAVSVQFYARPRLVRKIPAGAFHPRPKVDSALLRLDVRAQPAVPDVPPDVFFRVVRAGFGQKRKQLRNSLSAGLSSPKEQADEWLHAAQIDPRRRAETLSLAEWGALARMIHRQETPEE